MKTKFRISVITFVLFVSGLSIAQQNETVKIPQVEIAGTQVLSINSQVVDQEYLLYINLPRNYNDTNRKFPVLFLLDAQWDFPLMQALYGEQYYDGLVPDVVIVGITWGGENPNHDALRARDFTPSASGPTETSGNAPKFLEFIKTELIPFIESNYRVTNDRALTGSSLGGLFTLYAMFNETNLFTKYILTSPALQVDNGILGQIEKSFAEKNNDINARLYMAIGGYEYVPMLQNFYDILKSRNYKNLKIGYKVIDGIGHSGSKADGYSRGLIFTFERPEIKLDDSILNQYTGTYQVMPGMNIKVSVENNQLVALIPDNYRVILSAASENSFYMKGQYLNVEFIKDSNNKVSGANLETYNGKQSLTKIQ